MKHVDEEHPKGVDSSGIQGIEMMRANTGESTDSERKTVEFETTQV